MRHACIECALAIFVRRLPMRTTASAPEWVAMESIDSIWDTHLEEWGAMGEKQLWSAMEEPQCMWGSTYLHMAASHPKVPIRVLKFLLARPFPLPWDVKDGEMGEGQSPLWAAVRMRMVDRVALLLDHGLDWREKDDRGRTLVHAAAIICACGTNPLLPLLREFSRRGILSALGINARDDQCKDTPLDAACSCTPQTSEAIRALLLYGARPSRALPVDDGVKAKVRGGKAGSRRKGRLRNGLEGTLDSGSSDAAQQQGGAPAPSSPEAHPFVELMEETLGRGNVDAHAAMEEYWRMHQNDWVVVICLGQFLPPELVHLVVQAIV
eukprot:TRINITY_DN12982_c0_g1_i1.p1 TRINITY_DN12982_c0_g1~~TRINITY_DN12982_c0_g1_i1.p1  ORF type:complete len:324 (+),score=35.16 TRINITY_DN12982_c0_g1_i1:229-1200(+)